jgi:hypothetical protein
MHFIIIVVVVIIIMIIIIIKAGGTYTLCADVLWTVVTMVGFPILSLAEV